MGRPIKTEPVTFNPEKHFLGRLCKKNHEHENTGQSIRYHRNQNSCAMCVREQRRNYPEATRQRQAALQKQWRLEHKEAAREIAKRWVATHGEEYKQKTKEREANLEGIDKDILKARQRLTRAKTDYRIAKQILADPAAYSAIRVSNAEIRFETLPKHIAALQAKIEGLRQEKRQQDEQQRQQQQYE